MARPKTHSHSSSRAHGNGRLYEPFLSGEYLTISQDPQHCYVVGLRLQRGQVIETLASNNWASGTRFTTEVAGRRIEYEVSGRTMMKVKNPSK